MEFMDGVTLMHMITGRTLDNNTLLSLAIEIADALDVATLKASSSGISSLRTFSSHPKILDFGGAKITAAKGSATQVPAQNTNSGTAGGNLTSPGAAIRTVAY